MAIKEPFLKRSVNNLAKDLNMLLSSIHICTVCKKELPRESKFCDNCGRNVEDYTKLGFWKRFRRMSRFTRIFSIVVFSFVVLFSLIYLAIYIFASLI